MKRVVWAGLWAFLILWNSDAAALSLSQTRVHDVLAECHAAYQRLGDYQGTLRHEVWEEGGGVRRHDISVTFRKPAFLHLRWQTGLHAGTILLTRPTRAPGPILIRLGGWFEYVTMSIAPTAEIGDLFAPALKDVNAWLYALRELARRPAAHPSLQLVEVHPGDPQLAEGRVILSVPSFLIRFRDNTVDTYEFVIERGTGIPFEMVLRGASGELRQRLTYLDLQVNIGIPQQTFARAYDTVAGSNLTRTGTRAYDTGANLTRTGTDLDVRGFTQSWQRRSGEIRDYTGVWVTEARQGSRLVHRQATFKFRKPFDVYMAWDGASGELREALFRQGWNGGRVRVRSSLFGLAVIGDLAPDGYWAQQESRYPINEFGFDRIVERLQTQLLRGWLQGELEIQFRGIKKYDGRPCYVLEFIFPNSQWRKHPYNRVVVHWDIVHRVPVKQEAYDWSNQLVARYGFQDLRFNVSLDDTDFDATNPEYGFLLFRHIPWLDWFLTGRE